MAKRKVKQHEETQATAVSTIANTAIVDTTPTTDVDISKTETTTAPQSYLQLVSNLVCRLNELAGDNYNRQAVVKQAEKLLLQYESSALQSTIQYCFAELDVQQPVDIKWGVVVNAIRDAVTLAQK